MLLSIASLVFKVLLIASLLNGIRAGPATAAPVVPPAPRAGEQLWVARFQPADTPYGSAVSPDGARVYVTGYSLTTGYDYVTLAYDVATGTQLWAAMYQGPDDSLDIAHAVASSPDGRVVYVTGLSGPYNKYDYVTVAYDAASSLQLWQAAYNGTGDGEDVACCLQASEDGLRVFVTGYSVGADGTYDFATVAYDALSGTELWTARYSGRAGDSEAATSIAARGDRVYLTGAGTAGTVHGQFVTVAYDASSGGQMWATHSSTGSGQSGIARSLDVAPDGSSLFVTGCRSPDDNIFVCVGEGDFATFAYDAATGKQRWTARFDGSVHGDDGAYAVRVAPNGTRVYVTGYSEGPTLSSFATLAYDAATGDRVWSALNDRQGGYACCLAVTQDGSKVVVSGYGYVPDRLYTDMVTISYDAANGRKLWADRYDGPGHGWDLTTTIVASPDSSGVYVSGSSEGLGLYYDFVTIAYAA